MKFLLIVIFSLLFTSLTACSTSFYTKVKEPTLHYEGMGRIGAEWKNNNWQSGTPIIFFAVSNPNNATEHFKVICHHADNEMLGYVYKDLVVPAGSDGHVSLMLQKGGSFPSQYKCYLRQFLLY